MKKLFLSLVLLFVCFGLRAQSAGKLDTSFNANDNGRFGTGSGGGIVSPIVLSNGKILGICSNYNGVSVNGVARINPDGSLDTSFHYGGGVGGGSVDIIRLQSSGKIIIAGDFTLYDGVSVKHIARLNSDGTIDPTFTGGSGVNMQNNSCCANINDMEIQSDDKIIIAGFFDSVHHSHRNSIARLNSNGTLDASFTGSASSGGAMGGTVFDIEIQPDGKIL